MGNLIACRLGCYAGFRDQVWTHLPQTGLNHLEIDVPTPAEAPELKARLKDHGLAISSMQGTLDVKQDDVANQLRPQFDIMGEFDTPTMFVSVSRGDQDEDITWPRLRAAGDLAAQHKVTLVLETHPNLITNGDIARHIGSPGAVRAVGTAVGKNPIPFLIPCHRVIRKMGGFGNYREGPTRKKIILGWETVKSQTTDSSL